MMAIFDKIERELDKRRIKNTLLALPQVGFLKEALYSLRTVLENANYEPGKYSTDFFNIFITELDDGKHIKLDMPLGSISGSCPINQQVEKMIKDITDDDIVIDIVGVTYFDDATEEVFKYNLYEDLKEALMNVEISQKYQYFAYFTLDSEINDNDELLFTFAFFNPILNETFEKEFFAKNNEIFVEDENIIQNVENHLVITWNPFNPKDKDTWPDTEYTQQFITDQGCLAFVENEWVTLHTDGYRTNRPVRNTPTHWAEVPYFNEKKEFK